ncbi:MAG TPA: hypothetical protein VGY54_14850 [Polyangiaceae bacterium]|jgi:hypothetical protein|nr:hypothetical protein [Polyangiaceae bacterium]
MSLTPPPLRSGSVPAREFSHGGHGGSEAAPPTPPSRRRASPARYLCGWVVGAGCVIGAGTQKPIMQVLGARQSTLLWHGKAHLPYATLQ